ncbi:MAG: gamma-glutamyltransferase [Gammaproteobacteria bacterium]|nr:MAG: gamma-glutamyltransferase [Gammaproteobacteria bacterium]
MRTRLILLALIVLLPAAPVVADEAIFSERDIFHPVFGQNGMVSTQEELATRIGVEILEAGGNAVDAGVAIGFALAVTLPRAGNLGGGGFMLIHSAEDDETVALDFRETAPAAAHRDMYLDEDGNVVPGRSRFTHLAVGVPGSVAGLALAAERYGTRPLAELIAPAIKLAEEGITVTPDLANSLASLRARFEPWPASRSIFFDDAGQPLGVGATLVQSDLAHSLRLIAEQGTSAFYDGEIAERLVADMEAHGGLITREDLRGYQPVMREPVTGTYRGHEIISMPPPSSGGAHIVQILNTLEGFPLADLGHNSAAAIHLLAEGMKLAYADRSEYLGDTDFVDVPLAELTAKSYGEALRASIDPDRARPAEEIRPGRLLPFESNDTTHYSVMDSAGNVVATTYTINFSYGSGIVAAGTGILLNNEMDDFSAKPGVPNAFGLIGGDANAVEPGKRPLSSMTPTLVRRDGEIVLATGSPGGSLIITSVLQILLNVIDYDMNIAAATAAPRIHHQWLPDELRIERGLSVDTLRLLEALGHNVQERDAMGGTQSIMRGPGGFYGASDPRRPGALTLGY